MLYADVCVNTPLGRRAGAAADAGTETFTYAVPDRLAGRVQPGHLAWVPFRGRRLQGVVLSLNDAAPDFDTHEIISLVWAEPVLTPAQIALAHWVSGYYLAPLIEALRLMLPAGLSQRGRTVLVRTARPVPSGLTPRQTALLDRIARQEGDWAEVTEGLRTVLAAVTAAGALPAVHCCAAEVPYPLLVRAGARAVSVDLTLHRVAADDALGEALDAGLRLVAGLVAGTGSVRPAEGAVLAPVLGLGARLGFAPDDLVPRVALSPTCGLAGADARWVRTALTALRTAGRALRQDEDTDQETTDAR